MFCLEKNKKLLHSQQYKKPAPEVVYIEMKMEYWAYKLRMAKWSNEILAISEEPWLLINIQNTLRSRISILILVYQQNSSQQIYRLELRHILQARVFGRLFSRHRMCNVCYPLVNTYEHRYISRSGIKRRWRLSCTAQGAFVMTEGNSWF